MAKQKEKIIFIICTVIFIVAVVIITIKWNNERRAQNKFESLSNTTEIEAEDDIFSELGIENPGKVLDWEKLMEENKDIYAWIYIPDTNIDYPILQHETDNTYYLNYNLDGSKGYPGCIYTENYNRKDFLDYNTVIYGHNMRNGSMFADVHDFKDAEFFENHRYAYIYLPDKVIIYDIYANYVFTNEHILYSYDCFSQEGYGQYLEMIDSTYRERGNFREDAVVTEETPIITLSTCVTGQDDKRLLLQAVYVGHKEL